MCLLPFGSFSFAALHPWFYTLLLGWSQNAANQAKLPSWLKEPHEALTHIMTVVVLKCSTWLRRNHEL